jgi:aldose 1-epimerase
MLFPAVLVLTCSLLGTVAARVVYTIPRHGTSLSINMSATTDAPTPLSMINHAYFNLKGAGAGDVLDHVLQLNAASYTPAAEGQLVPSGAVVPVAGSMYDFRRPKPIRQDILRANGGATRSARPLHCIWTAETCLVLPRRLAVVAC